jgi:hypothetical protein
MYNQQKAYTERGLYKWPKKQQIHQK